MEGMRHSDICHVRITPEITGCPGITPPYIILMRIPKKASYIFGRADD
jgi:hypothetical protein